MSVILHGMRTALLLLLAACTPTIPDTTVVTEQPDTDQEDGGEDTVEVTDTGASNESESIDVLVEVPPDTPCFLQISWNRTQAADTTWIEFSVDEDDWLSTPAQDATVGAHSQLLIGAPCETEIRYRFVTEEDGKSRTEPEQTAWTGALPWGFPEAQQLTWDPKLATSERWILGSLDADQSSWYSGPFIVFIVDRQGRVVWYYEVPDDRLALQAQVSWDGTHVVLEGSTNYVYDDDVEPTVTALSLDHAYFEERTIPNLGFTLDEIEDGTIFYEKNASERSLVELSKDGTERVIWTCDDFMRDAGLSVYNCAPNTIVWVPATDTILWSMYPCDTVLEIDRTSGEVIHQWGQIPGSWDVDPVQAMIDYQHFPNYTPDGTLLVSTHVQGGGPVQMAREFTVDQDSQTLVETWSYGEDSPYYATYGGEATRVGENTLISYGTDGALVEVTPDGEVAWELRWMTGTHPHLIGHLTLIGDLYALNQGPADR